MIRTIPASKVFKLIEVDLQDFFDRLGLRLEEDFNKSDLIGFYKMTAHETLAKFSDHFIYRDISWFKQESLFEPSNEFVKLAQDIFNKQENYSPVYIEKLKEVMFDISDEDLTGEIKEELRKYEKTRN